MMNLAKLNEAKIVIHSDASNNGKARHWTRQLGTVGLGM